MTLKIVLLLLLFFFTSILKRNNTFYSNTEVLCSVVGDEDIILKVITGKYSLVLARLTQNHFLNLELRKRRNKPSKISVRLTVSKRCRLSPVEVR